MQKLFETIARITGHDCLDSELNEIIDSYEKEKEKQVYEYKNKPYTIDKRFHFKINGIWTGSILYKCNYINPDGIFWGRTKKEFEKLFKKVK